MKDNEIPEELKNVEIKNHLEVYYDVSYEFRKCEYCDEPLLGHLKPKCPKVDYSEDDVKKFERCIENIDEFKEAIRAVRVEKLTKRLEEQMVKMKYMTKSEIEESIEMLVTPDE